jgi:hypothetical protein
LFRPFPGEDTATHHHDLLNARSVCRCSRCELIRDKINPEIRIDADLDRLKSNNHSSMTRCDQVVFLNQFQSSQSNLPRFRFLDTIVMENGEPAYAIYFQEGRAKVIQQVQIKSWIVERKEQLDLRYQIKKYERQHPAFHFAAFEHESEKRIKEFENNIKYKMPPVLNKIAILKLRHLPEEQVISKNEFEDLFSLTKQRALDIRDVEYIQVFPIMYGEEDFSYPKTIKYFRATHCRTKSFKLAESYIITWREKNESLEKMEEKVFEEIAAETGEAVSEEMRLEYMTYKLLIYFEEVSNLRIEEAIVHYLTNDEGRTFYFRKIECVKFEKRIAIDDIGIDLPAKKDIPPEDHIDLRQEMRKLFSGFQQQFQRLDREREEMESKVRKDREFSNYVFKTITQKKGDNLHKILQSGNQRYKKEQLGL